MCCSPAAFLGAGGEGSKKNPPTPPHLPSNHGRNQKREGTSQRPVNGSTEALLSVTGGWGRRSPIPSVSPVGVMTAPHRFPQSPFFAGGGGCFSPQLLGLGRMLGWGKAGTANPRKTSEFPGTAGPGQHRLPQTSTPPPPPRAPPGPQPAWPGSQPGPASCRDLSKSSRESVKGGGGRGRPFVT